MAKPLPTEYKIRKAHFDDAEAIASVHVKAWKTAYKGMIEPAYLATLNIESRLELRKKILLENEGIHLVATFNNKIIAFYDAGPLRCHENQNLSKKQLQDKKESGEVYAIYILQAHQHLGLGQALFKTGRDELKKIGLLPFITWVLQDNHQALQFYEKMGGKLFDKTVIEIGKKQYIEVAYRFF